mgnify:FL=1
MRKDDMNIQIQQEGKATVVGIQGRLDTVTAPACEEQLRNLVENGSTHFVLDLAQLDYISSAGLRVLLIVSKLLTQGSICLTGLKPNVRTVLDISGLSGMFKIGRAHV